MARVFATAWPTAAARTWNRHRAAVRSFGAWARQAELASAIERRPETRTPAPALDPPRLEELCRRVDPPLRERTLWWLLYESAAPVAPILSLNVEQLDLAAREARTPGGPLTWRTETARLLPDLLTGRTRGPLFLADRRPAPARAPAPADLCPHTGRRRLSYERAEYLFKQATKPLDPTGNGYTLLQLRPRP